MNATYRCIEYKLDKVKESGETKIQHDFNIQSDREIKVRGPDIVLIR